MQTVSDYFGCLVFDDRVMKAKLPSAVYNSLRKTIDEGERLNSDLANAVADAMKDWAVSHGATHFTHWFQPLTGITAEKHDSFITPSPDGGVIMEFSGKELIKGEPDASSFPSGGLRATFEARGYTAWDPTSYAFIKDKTLCIPTAFCSYCGEALDKKTPLLRSMQALNKQAMRILRLFGNTDVKCVHTSVGPEQEYFLVDKALYEKRKDLMFCGRTLFGAKPPKGQELDDHYFGVIKPRVAAYMADLNEELWKLGILAKTEHNEVAPAQHELAPVFTTTNIAADHNQITMELMQKIAKKHGMVCLLHEKPFAGVNGSGKHNNWSMTTGTGANLLEPGETPYENAQFLLMLCAVIQAVDDYQDMLRLSITSASNDLRLGADEAPPAVISVYVGEELEEILNAIERGEPYGGKEKELIKVGVHALPKLPKDTTDRNRTSPFAFTGNKFEFRMPGSSSSISGANVVINTAVAESLRQYANELELSDNFENDLHELIRRVIRKHKRIIFNGNGYGEEWLKEAERRGLLNLRTTPDCAHAYLEQKNVELFIRHSVYSEIELAARYKMKLDNYCKVLRIEAETMLHMLRRDILPAVSAYSAELANAAISKQELGIECSFEKDGAAHISRLISSCCDVARELEAAIADVSALPENYTRAVAGRDRLIPTMTRLRSLVDELEVHTSAEYWPMPTYGEILFSVN